MEKTIFYDMDLVNRWIGLRNTF